MFKSVGEHSLEKLHQLSDSDAGKDFISSLGQLFDPKNVVQSDLGHNDLFKLMSKLRLLRELPSSQVVESYSAFTERICSICKEGKHIDVIVVLLSLKSEFSRFVNAAIKSLWISVKNVDCERYFSMYRCVMPDRRANMTPDNMKMMLSMVVCSRNGKDPWQPTSRHGDVQGREGEACEASKQNTSVPHSICCSALKQAAAAKRSDERVPPHQNRVEAMDGGGGTIKQLAIPPQTLLLSPPGWLQKGGCKDATLAARQQYHPRTAEAYLSKYKPVVHLFTEACQRVIPFLRVPAQRAREWRACDRRPLMWHPLMIQRWKLNCNSSWLG
ncbi:hypothetical protein PR048_004586 [Dryococelus australis]|uniref:HAT C-terminal dimerisation domain-containing protein n=1 Tax=Dryococelus australis TaxID=614101 RepID=A0ABQ9I5U6_9NEOP|nr:hypothetical protein PR048_004586 [Dryococelus australis]